MKRWIPVAIMLVAGYATSASAGIYFGASALSTSAEFQDAAASFDTKATAWKAFGGMTFFKFVGVEASYRDLGSHSGTSGYNSVKADLTAYDLSVRGILPVGKNIQLFAKAGYADITSKGSFDNLEGVPTIFDESSWQFMYGVGVDWTFFMGLGVRAEWEQYEVETSLNSFSVGAYWRF
jgi:hypothetical protein